MEILKLNNTSQQEILPYYFNAVNHLGKHIQIKMRPIKPDESEEELSAFARSMAKIFSACEPMTVAAGITEEECFEEIHLYLQSARKDGLSLILTNEENGKIIGGIIGRDFYYDENEDPYVGLNHKEKFQPICDLINISKKKFTNILENEGHILEPGMVFRISYLGFFSKYIILNDGDGYSLTAISFRKFEEYLKSLGYKYLYGEATNPGSQKLVANSGFTVDEIILPYSNYTPFEKINFHDNSIQGIGNSLCGSIHRLSKEFPPLIKRVA